MTLEAPQPKNETPMPEVRVRLPSGPPTLHPGAAEALLRLLLRASRALQPEEPAEIALPEVLDSVGRTEVGSTPSTKEMQAS